MNILFVCTGNTCRSPMAEAYLRHALQMRGICGCTVASAGTGAQDGTAASANAAGVMQELGIIMTDFRSRELTEVMMQHADRVLCMSARHRQAALALAPDCGGKTGLLLDHDVPDPYGGDRAVYRRVLEIMRPALDHLAEEIGKQQP